MEYSIRKANKCDFSKCQKLSEKFCMKNVEDNTKGFIGSSLDSEDYDDLYVAKCGREILGMVVIRDLDSEDAEFYEIKLPKKAKIIEKFLVDAQYRGIGVGSALLKFAEKKFSDFEFYADIAHEPFENIASKKCFIKNGYKQINIVPYYKEELNLETTWAVFKKPKRAVR